VDAGIDTGSIVERRLLEITGTETTLGELEEADDRLAAEMMAAVVAERLVPGRVPGASPHAERHPICHRLGAEERRQADNLVRAGRARECFEAWRKYCLPGAGFRLPPEFGGPER
jgi:methionyl-tRNA formyltransferase